MIDGCRSSTDNIPLDHLKIHPLDFLEDGGGRWQTTLQAATVDHITPVRLLRRVHLRNNGEGKPAMLDLPRLGRQRSGGASVLVNLNVLVTVGLGVIKKYFDRPFLPGRWRSEATEFPRVNATLVVSWRRPSPSPDDALFDHRCGDPGSRLKALATIDFDWPKTVISSADRPPLPPET